jgi:hypothetical protein
VGGIEDPMTDEPTKAYPKASDPSDAKYEKKDQTVADVKQLVLNRLAVLAPYTDEPVQLDSIAQTLQRLEDIAG